MDLDPFATAVALCWRAHTSFVHGGGADGDLVATLDTGRELVLPLDVYMPAELAADSVRPPMSGNLGVASVEHVDSIEDIRQAVRAWCSEQLHRDDVTFED